MQQGKTLSPEERQKTTKRLARCIGLDERYIYNGNPLIEAERFTRKVLHER